MGDPLSPRFVMLMPIRITLRASKQHEAGSRPPKALGFGGQVGALFSRGGEGTPTPRFYQTKPVVKLANGAVSTCDAVCCVDYRKMTTGFVFPRSDRVWRKATDG